ncbi:hypothetical protein AgCh_035682 [Apium graveolens]
MSLAYFKRLSLSRRGPMVKTTGRIHAFFEIFMSVIPKPVMTRPEIENDVEQMITNVETDVPARGEVVVYNSDDDFVNPAPWSKKKNDVCESKKVNKRLAVKGNVKGKPERRIAKGKIEQRTEIAKKDDDIAKIRNSPTLLTDMIYALSDEQQQWVRDVDFESLLNFELVEIPQRLAYKVLEAFDDRSCTLILKRGDIEITEQAVHDVIGMPCRGAEIEFGNDEMISERIDNWRSQFPVTKGQSLGKACEVVDRIKQTGEIMYVDRVCFQGKKLVLRLYPAFRGWTKEKLKEREVMEAEDNAFGSGVILNLATIEELEENEILFWKGKAYTENEEEVPENENEDTGFNNRHNINIRSHTHCRGGEYSV